MIAFTLIVCLLLLLVVAVALFRTARERMTTTPQPAVPNVLRTQRQPTVMAMRAVSLDRESARD